ncbi:triphosphoribosyl-dephospho-CoA synthase [Anaerococcus senegalensis]|uniref:triphosphoribosyl-dephospho-CoA synthase n=1 Tax=Anaerococcus senegalensis TaxID=1288120 RepID=UPI0005912692|nr:triphosphoribosyl-dephospho-CoA synthase [Anaerococcus senegalensis]
MRDIKIYTNALKNSIKKELSRSFGFGCVNYFSQGSHDDMDWKLFEKSAKSIILSFNNIDWYNIKDFYDLKKVGIDIEKKMFLATNNINTHKGLIFLQLFLAYAYVHNINWNEIENFTINFSKPLKKDYIKNFNAMNWNKNDLKDIRFYPLTGFKKILHIVDDIYLKNISDTDLTLLLISIVDDTTTFHRSNLKLLRKVQNDALTIIKNKNSIDYKNNIKKLNDFYVKNHLSSGGVADLFTTIRTLEALKEDFCD